MLWLPKWLKENGDRLEAELPSRRVFLFLGAAAAVGAMVPEPSSPFKWKDPLPVQFIPQRKLLARIRITKEAMEAHGVPGPFWRAAVEEMRQAAEDIAARERAVFIDPAGVHGLVERRGLFVPAKLGPSWKDEIMGNWLATRPRPDRALYEGEFADDRPPQPALDNTDYARDYTWLGLDRKPWQG